MVNCSICKGPDAPFGVCSNATHLVHQECLQNLFDQAGADVEMLKCPTCGKELTLRSILGFERRGIVIRNKLEMITELSKRKLLTSLGTNKMIV